VDIEADPDGLVGQVLVSRYRIEARLGHGAMGTVYRARHVKVGRMFAIKILHPRLLGDDKVRRRFAREAELAGSLHHLNVVSVVDTGETPDGMHYLVMEYAEGATLFQLIGDLAPMSEPRVIALVRQLCAGLAHAHERGLIHRDFKPENVIIDRGSDGSDTPKIVDFGVAILRDDAISSNADRLTTSGLVLGTPHYMAPEHATGAPIDHRIDLFALGVMTFEMLTGRPPFDGDGVDVARANLMQDTPVMSVRVPNLRVDPLLEAFTRKMMMKSRDARPATAKAAGDLIDLIERDRPATAAALGIALPEERPAPATSRSPAARSSRADRRSGVADPELEEVAACGLARDLPVARRQLAAPAVIGDDPGARARGREPLLDPAQRALDRRVAHERARVRREHHRAERIEEVQRVELVPRQPRAVALDEPGPPAEVERPGGVVGRGDLHRILLDAPPHRAGHQRTDQAQLAHAGADVEHARARRRGEQLRGADRGRHRGPVEVRPLAKLLGKHLVERRVGHRRAVLQRLADRQDVERHRARISPRSREAIVATIPQTVAAPVLAERRSSPVDVPAAAERRGQGRSGHQHEGPRDG
jgi:tRNA A-37 threonylcarbamoyl transferase component Bud32